MYTPNCCRPTWLCRGPCGCAPALRFDLHGWTRFTGGDQSDGEYGGGKQDHHGGSPGKRTDSEIRPTQVDDLIRRGGLTIFLHGPEIGEDVLPRHFGLQDVRRTGEVAGRAEDVDRLLHGAVDLVGRGKRHRRLRADAAPKRQAIAEAFFTSAMSRHSGCTGLSTVTPISIRSGMIPSTCRRCGSRPAGRAALRGPRGSPPHAGA